MFKHFLILFSSLVFTGRIFAQYSVAGSTTQTSCSQFLVTPELTNQVGSFHKNATQDLNFDFTLNFSVNFGCDNFGGNGLVFVLKNGPWATGTGGAGMGYQGMPGNSLGVEFDTYNDNGTLGNWDIAADHMGLFRAGSTDHNIANTNNLSGVAVNILSGANAENCLFHSVEIIWDYLNPTSQTYTIKVDGITTITETRNFINLDFFGNSIVLWGWTGSTNTIAGVDNEQIVGLALEPNFTISATNCPGQLINFTDNSFSQNPIVAWSWDFDGLGTSILQNPSFTFMTAGTHDVTLTITDNTGCSNSAVIQVGAGFNVDPTADANPICPNAPTGLNANATPYVGNTCCFDLIMGDSWDDGWAGNNITVSVNGVLTGTYFPAIQGLGQPYYETVSLCFNHGDVVAFTMHGTQYPGECSYEIVDDAGAQIIFVPPAGAPPPAPPAGSWTNDSTITFTVNCGMPPPPYTYSWDNPGFLNNSTLEDPTATIPSTTWFHVDVTDPLTGCTITDSIQLVTLPPVTAAISGNPTICNGTSTNLAITFTGTPPFNLTVNGPGGPYTNTGIMTMIYNLSVSQNGTYTVGSVTGSGCVGTFSGTANVTVITPPSVDIAATAQYCLGDPIAPLTVISGGGGTVNWYNNSGLIGSLATGASYTPVQGVGAVTYYATTTEVVLGCVGPADNVTITVHPIPVAPAWTGTTTYCDGDLPTPLTGTPTLGGTMKWYADAGLTVLLSSLLSYNPTLVVGTFTIYLTETANGCQGPSTPITITVKPTPTTPVVTGDLLYCEGEAATPLIATPTIGGVINWQNSLGINIGMGVSYTPGLSNGFTDIFIYETLNGCSGASTTVTIEVQPAPAVNVTNEIKICLGDSVSVTALNNGYDITWSDGQLGETVWLGPDTTTMYYVTATNPLCGFAVDSIRIVVNYRPIIEAGNDTLIGLGGEVTLWAESPGDVTYTWIPDVDECLNDECSEVYDVPDQATLYVVIATDPIGCSNSDSVLVDINGYMEVFVPNIFSPNGDGWNDLLEVKGPRLFNYYIQIYDRWGKVVFESSEQKDYWDGKLNGSELAPQTFVYLLSGESVLGDKISKEGNVTIIK